MPWLTFDAPGRMTFLHQAQTRVGRSDPALIAFLFMIATLDEWERQTFKEKSGREAPCPFLQPQGRKCGFLSLFSFSQSLFHFEGGRRLDVAAESFAHGG